jgi:succinoglycan biosynthesis transport protein ExoP
MSSEIAALQVVPPAHPSASSSEGWADAPTLAPARSPLERPLAALRRYKYIVAAVGVLSIIAGIVATKFVKPLYEVRATILIAAETPLQDKTGPIRSRELLSAGAWVELLRSYRVADAVVRKLALYVKPDAAADSVAFSGFQVSDRFVPGHYTLEVPKNRSGWALSLENATTTDSGAPGDSIGRKLGFRWQIPPERLAQFAGKKIEFTVSTPRETSVSLMKRLNTNLQEGSTFLNLSMQDEDGTLGARTMNTWVNEFVSVASSLKKKNLIEFGNILGGQLDYAEGSLKASESALENFRVHTITLPAESGPVAAGVTETRDPALKAYFDQKIQYDDLKHDRVALQEVLAKASAGAQPYEAALLIPSVAQSPGGAQLKALLDQLYKAQSELNAARQVYTDNYPAVRDMIKSVEALKTQTIPQQANSLLVQLKGREGQFDQRIASSSNELQAIPARTIEEMRLRRAVTVAEGLYGTLKSRFAEAKLAEASAVPDVSILDSAIAPLQPVNNTGPKIMALVTLAGFALAIGLALLLDMLDGRIRYPEQATQALGLSVVGTLPTLPKGDITHHSPEQLTQLVESFRTLRLNVINSVGDTASFAISSPSPGDGKSFVASNLAMSFAEAGFRTVLVDGDTRRGTLHGMFGLPRSPGLTDLLEGNIKTADIVHQTAHDRLFVMPCGTAKRRSPELLTSPKLVAMVADLRRQYDVVIFDTPPMAAGIDSYAISAATGNVLVVLRIGQTEKKMAAAKLMLVDRLPINIIGTVLNAAPSYGEYAYYGYVDGYGAGDEEDAAGLVGSGSDAR